MADHDPLPEGLREVGPATPTWQPPDPPALHDLATILRLLARVRRRIHQRHSTACALNCADLNDARIVLEEVRDRLRRREEAP